MKIEPSWKSYTMSMNSWNKAGFLLDRSATPSNPSRPSPLDPYLAPSSLLQWAGQLAIDFVNSNLSNTCDSFESIARLLQYPSKFETLRFHISLRIRHSNNLELKVDSWDVSKIIVWEGPSREWLWEALGGSSSYRRRGQCRRNGIPRYHCPIPALCW